MAGGIEMEVNLKGGTKKKPRISIPNVTVFWRGIKDGQYGKRLSIGVSCQELPEKITKDLDKNGIEKDRKNEETGEVHKGFSFFVGGTIKYFDNKVKQLDLPLRFSADLSVTRNIGEDEETGDDKVWYTLKGLDNVTEIELESNDDDQGEDAEEADDL